MVRGWNIGWLERVGFCVGMGNFERFLGRVWEILGFFVWGNVGNYRGREEKGVEGVVNMGLVLGVLCGFVSALGVF